MHVSISMHAEHLMNSEQDGNCTKRVGVGIFDIGLRVEGGKRVGLRIFDIGLKGEDGTEGAQGVKEESVANVMDPLWPKDIPLPDAAKMIE
jgi:hypothetical protein